MKAAQTTNHNPHYTVLNIQNVRKTLQLSRHCCRKGYPFENNLRLKSGDIPFVHDIHLVTRSPILPKFRLYHCLTLCKMAKKIDDYKMDSQSMKFEFKITFVEISFIATEHGHPGSDEVGLFRYHRVPWPVVLWSVPQTPEIWAISWSWQPGETRKHSYGTVCKKTRCLMHIGNRSFVTGHFRPRHIHLSLVLRNQIDWHTSMRFLQFSHLPNETWAAYDIENVTRHAAWWPPLDLLSWVPVTLVKSLHPHSNVGCPLMASTSTRLTE